ncbi:MAG: hypothetical protein J3K34DRAFT_377923 [Monoraphidium minutum]|nr:MAG: hypothetical protein J3K34DRAFT_377923 [Monoraphidium minutum]
MGAIAVRRGAPSPAPPGARARRAGGLAPALAPPQGARPCAGVPRARRCRETHAPGPPFASHPASQRRAGLLAGRAWGRAPPPLPLWPLCTPGSQGLALQGRRPGAARQRRAPQRRAGPHPLVARPRPRRPPPFPAAPGAPRGAAGGPAGGGRRRIEDLRLSKNCPVSASRPSAPLLAPTDV